ncbi:MAG TPA: PEGA domain-containing protein [Polyangiaceae bacterium]|nr:PEGA domain-containing protein [Polyangiaceae bacterium]
MRKTLYLLLCGASLTARPSLAGDAPGGRAGTRAADNDLGAGEARGGPGGSRAEAVSLAREHFLRGVELYRSGAYDASLAEFTRAYEAAPNYRILYNLAQIRAQQQDYVQALELFGRFVREGRSELSEARAADVAAEMAELRRRVAQLSVETNVEGATLTINDSRTASLPLPGPLAINAGVYQLRVQKLGRVPVTQTVTVAGGESPLVRFELLPDTSALDLGALPALPGPAEPLPVDLPAPSSNTALLVGLATTGVLAGATATFGFLTYRQSVELDQNLSSYPEGIDEIEASRSKLRTYALLTDVFGLAAAAAAGVTAFLHFSAPDTPTPPPRTRIGAGIGADGASLWVTGAL